MAASALLSPDLAFEFSSMRIGLDELAASFAQGMGLVEEPGIGDRVLTRPDRSEAYSLREVTSVGEDGMF